MTVFVVDSAESLPAHFAAEWTFAAMNALMNVQTIQLMDGGWEKKTLDFGLRGKRKRSTHLRETFSTHVTVEATFSGMNCHMSRPIFHSRELFMANGAFEWFLKLRMHKLQFSVTDAKHPRKTLVDDAINYLSCVQQLMSSYVT